MPTQRLDISNNPDKSMPVRRTFFAGVCWFRQEDYQWVRDTLVDGHRLPPSYQEWQRRHERALEMIELQGHRVEKVYLHVATFAAWCKERGLDINCHALAEFADEFMSAKHSPRH